MKAWDRIRARFAAEPEAARRGLTAAHFSFNVPAGRCEECSGEGYETVEMQFLADVQLLCPVCQGKRFKPEVLAVTHRGRSIADVLAMSVDEALALFDPARRARLRPASHARSHRRGWGSATCRSDSRSRRSRAARRSASSSRARSPRTPRARSSSSTSRAPGSTRRTPRYVVGALARRSSTRAPASSSSSTTSTSSAPATGSSTSAPAAAPTEATSSPRARPKTSRRPTRAPARLSERRSQEDGKTGRHPSPVFPSSRLPVRFSSSCRTRASTT